MLVGDEHGEDDDKPTPADEIERLQLAVSVLHCLPGDVGGVGARSSTARSCGRGTLRRWVARRRLQRLRGAGHRAPVLAVLPGRLSARDGRRGDSTSLTLGVAEDQVVRHADVGGRSVAWSSLGSGPVLVVGGWWSSHLAARLGGRGVPALRRATGRDEPGRALRPARAPASPTAGRPRRAGRRRWPCSPASSTRVGADRVHLLGASSGCPVAATYAAQNPDRVDRLVLYGGYVRGADIAAPAARESMLALVEQHWGLGLARAQRGLHAERQRPRPAGVRGVPAPVGARARRPPRRCGPSTRSTPPTRWPPWPRPTLVLHRRQDGAIPFALGRDLAERIRAGDLRRARRRRALPVARRHRRPRRRRRGVPGGPGGHDTAASSYPGAEPALSERELEVLRLVAAGRTDAEIARAAGAEHAHGAPARRQHPRAARRRVEGGRCRLGGRPRPALTGNRAGRGRGPPQAWGCVVLGSPP